MTCCVGIRRDAGPVFLSASRTSTGLEQLRVKTMPPLCVGSDSRGAIRQIGRPGGMIV